MNKVILLTLSIILTSCWGTDQGKGKFYGYTIKNESGKDIQINSYSTFYPERNTAIVTELENNTELTRTYQDTLPPRGYNFISFFEGDSLVIIYNNERKQIFTFKNQQYNDRNLYNFTGSNVTYTFTEQDFENAESCNWNCD
ncbi:hypothetical protein OO013_05725 [Mangrovivirga sp. M17]|uniref:Lipoprotein n=1 Tax=Mangrovivirga halotolerans TaxID=2993936 RepID=A0ABT3RNG7_9BACT|nr:hypothetical protein [Mangrovivirga halotolerans]MCX2743354.1 hypothetical protein [Mangrovivirga halotolerans]